MSGGQVTRPGVPDVIRGQFFESDPLVFRAYLTDADGSPLFSSDFTTKQLALNVYQTSGNTPRTAVYTAPTPGPCNSFIATGPSLLTTGWQRGGAGYNFEFELASRVFTPAAGITYRYEFVLQVTSLDYVTLVFELLCVRGAQ